MSQIHDFDFPRQIPYGCVGNKHPENDLFLSRPLWQESHDLDYQNHKLETLLCLVRFLKNNQNRKMIEFTDFTCLFGPTPCLGTLE